MNEMNATLEYTVTEAQTAKTMKSGALAVLATPALVAMMEECACKALEGSLEEGQTSVGTALSLKHTAATPVGMKVTITAVLTEKEGRRLLFDVVANDEKGEIGRCTPERCLVMAERFTEKTYQKLEG